MSDDRCTCGFMPKIEDAWKRIYSFLHDRKGHQGLVFDFKDASLRILNHEMLEEVRGGRIPGEVSMVPQNEFKDFAYHLKALADQIPSPEPKEREWRVGDVVMLKPGAVIGVDDPQGLVNFGPFIINCKHPDSLAFRHNGFPRHTNTQNMRSYRNLSIEAEQAGEGG